MEPERQSVAGRWFAVKAELERVHRLAMLWRTIRWFVQGLLTWGLTMGDFDPRRSCDVIVYRRDTGHVVAMFAYDFLGEATNHVDDLLRRLETTHVHDFCRELGIGIEAVIGAGSSEPLDPETVWRAMPALERQSELW